MTAGAGRVRAALRLVLGLISGLGPALVLVLAGANVVPVVAFAGAFTHDRVLGFSEDGRYFAFKTFGLQRGSGLPFANVFVVDLERDAWVAGTPVRRMRGEEDMAAVVAAPFAALADLRAETLQAADAVLSDLAIRRPATVLFARGLGEAHEAPARASVGRPHPDDPIRSPLARAELELDAIAVPGGADHCFEPEALRGYRLRLIGEDGRAEKLHEDTRIPASRGCPVAYRLDAVLSSGYPQPAATGVALISTWRQGFEGVERHVIAAPVPLP